MLAKFAFLDSFRGLHDDRRIHIRGSPKARSKRLAMKFRKKPVVIDAVQWIGEIGPIHDLGAGYLKAAQYSIHSASPALGWG
jgi:hypothetical protein